MGPKPVPKKSKARTAGKAKEDTERPGPSSNAEAGPSKITATGTGTKKGKGKGKKKMESDESEEEDEDNIQEQLQAFGLAHIDFTAVNTLLKDITAEHDPIGEEIAAAVWSYNIVDLDQAKPNAVKFVNPWNPRPVDPSKGQELKASMIASGMKPFILANHIYIIENVDRFDPACRQEAPKELWKAPILMGRDDLPLKIPGGGHRVFAVNKLISASRVLREKTLPLAIKKAEQRLEAAKHPEEVRTISAEIAETRRNLEKIAAAEPNLGFWGVTVLDEKKVTADLVRKLARNTQDYQYTEQSNEIIVNLLTEYNALKAAKVKGDPSDNSANIRAKLKKYPSLKTVFQTTQSREFLNSLGGKREANEEMGAITRMYLQTSDIGTVKFLEKAFVTDIAGIIITIAMSMHDMLFRVLTTGEVMTDVDHEQLQATIFEWYREELDDDAVTALGKKGLRLYHEVRQLTNQGIYVEGVTPELITLIENLNTTLHDEDSIPFSLSNTTYATGIGCYPASAMDVINAYFEKKKPELNGDVAWVAQKGSMERKLAFLTSQMPFIEICALPILTPRTFGHLVDVLDHLKPALLEVFSWLAPLSPYFPCVGHAEEPWISRHGIFNRLIDEMADPSSEFNNSVKNNRPKIEHDLSMFFMNNIDYLYEMTNDMALVCVDIDRPRGQAARWAQANYCNKWRSRIETDSPDTPDHETILSIIKAAYEAKTPKRSEVAKLWPLLYSLDLKCGWKNTLKLSRNFSREGPKLAMQVFVEMGLVGHYRLKLFEHSYAARALRIELFDFLTGRLPGKKTYKFPDKLSVALDPRPDGPPAKELVSANRRYRGFQEDQKKIVTWVNRLYGMDVVKVTRRDKHVHPAIVGKVEELLELLRQNNERLVAFAEAEDEDQGLEFSSWKIPKELPFRLPSFSVKKPLTWMFDSDSEEDAPADGNDMVVDKPLRPQAPTVREAGQSQGGDDRGEPKDAAKADDKVDDGAEAGPRTAEGTTGQQGTTEDVNMGTPEHRSASPDVSGRPPLPPVDVASLLQPGSPSHSVPPASPSTHEVSSDASIGTPSLVRTPSPEGRLKREADGSPDDKPPRKKVTAPKRRSPAPQG